MTNFDLKRWLTGCALGVSGRPYPLTNMKNLVGYSYNGSIPLMFDSYDEKKYPYSFVYYGGGENYYFYAFENPVVWQRASNYGPEECDYVKQQYYYGIKMLPQELQHGAPDWGIQYYLWTNTDIKDTDGNVVLAATKRIPVYEQGKLDLTMNIDKTDMLTGWLIGEKIAEMRRTSQQAEYLIARDLIMGTVKGHYTNRHTTTLAGYAFAYNKDLVSVYFSKLTNIAGSNVFTGCDSLVSASFPELVTAQFTKSDGTISTMSSLFSGCTSLQKVYLPKFTSGSGHFSGCTSLKEINLPCVPKLAGFSDCTSLKKVYAPLATSIISGAFRNCVSLDNNSIDLTNITSISSAAFSGCTGITELKFPALGKTPDTSLVLYSREGVFHQCTSLKKVDFHIISTLGEKSFYQCSSLDTVIIRTPSICTLNNVSCFTETPIANGTGYIYVPSELVNSYKANTKWSTYANQIRSIEDYPDICE